MVLNRKVAIGQKAGSLNAIGAGILRIKPSGKTTMVKIIIDNLNSKIVGYLDEEVQVQLDKVLSYKIKGAKYLLSVKRKQWDGVYHLYRRNFGQSFHSGLLSLVEEVLKINKVEYIRQDARIRPQQNILDLKFTPLPNFEPRDYQEFTIDRAIKATRGVLKVATGGGKTRIVSELIGRIKTAPFMFYVLTQDLMHQAHDVLSSTLNQKIGLVGGGEFDIQNINVCTIQTAVLSLNVENKKFNIDDYRFDEEDAEWSDKQLLGIEKMAQLRQVIGAAKGLYFDETHHAGAKTVREVLSASPHAFWRYGGSATPFREDGAEIMIQAMFGKKIVDISASYLIKNKYLIKPYILFDEIEHPDCMFSAYASIYKNCVSQNDKFNTHVADIANHLIRKGLSVLILVKQYLQGDFLKNLIPNTEFLTGKITNKDKRKQTIQDLRTGQRKCLVCTSLGDEGLDLPCLDAVLMAGGGASSTRVYQRIGRALRPSGSGKKKALVVYFEHKAKHLDKHARKAKKIMQAEPEFEIVDSGGPQFICHEIDEIMNLNPDKTSIENI